MKTFLATDSVRLNDTFEKKIEMVEIIQGSGFIREGDEFDTYSQFNQMYGEMAGGVRLDDRQKVENYLARIGLCFIEQEDTKVIIKINDPVGAMLYNSYLVNDEPAINQMNHTWQGESRERINKFLREKPWEKIEGLLGHSEYGFSVHTASALFSVMPETRFFEIIEADFEINLSKGSLWKIDRVYRVVGNTQPKRADISCDCGKQMKMYIVSNLESGRLSCRSCARRTTDFVAFYQSIVDEGYTIVKDFEDSRLTSMSQITLQCPDKTHQEYLTYPNNWMNKGQRCPSCSQNHVGEQRVRKFLQEKDIQFLEQIKFDGLIGIGGRKLSYDFMIELNGRSMLIEIDGEQHFSPTAFGGRDADVSEQAYQRQVRHDQLKDDFAVQNGLRLVRIQNVDSNYDFIIESLESILSGSDINYYGSLYQSC